jgi:large subunit ribosomal protein L25
VADKFTLEAQPRTAVGKKNNALRRSGFVPAVVYGPSVESFNVQIQARTLTQTLLKAGGTNVIDMQIEGRTQQVIARVVQRDIIRGDILHVDFLAVDARTTITATVPVHFVNEAPAVKAGYSLLNGIQSLEIEALASQLPNQIDVDLSALKDPGDTIHAGDIPLAPGITLITNPDEMVIRAIVHEEVVETVDDTVMPSQPERIERERAEDDEE